MYNQNSCRKITIVAHSMGGLVTLHFLTKFVEPAWKKKYIEAYVTLGVPWGGAAPAVETLLAGYHKIPEMPLKSFITEHTSPLYMPMIQSMEGMYSLLPNPDAFGNRVIVSTPNARYTSHDYAEMFDKANVERGADFVERVQGINPDFTPPGVDTYCYYGYRKKSTPATYEFKSETFQGRKSTITKGNGDGTVNIESLEACKRWKHKMGDKIIFKTKSYKNVGHRAIVVNKKVLADIGKIVGIKKKPSFLRQLWKSISG